MVSMVDIPADDAEVGDRVLFALGAGPPRDGCWRKVLWSHTGMVKMVLVMAGDVFLGVRVGGCCPAPG